MKIRSDLNAHAGSIDSSADEMGTQIHRMNARRHMNGQALLLVRRHEDATLVNDQLADQFRRRFRITPGTGTGFQLSSSRAVPEDRYSAVTLAPDARDLTQIDLCGI